MRADNVELALETLERGEGYVELTIEQFRDFYHKIINSKILNDHTVFAVFIEDQILIRFPEKSDAKFVTRVSHPKIKTTIVGLHASKISAICWS
jgi:hypothetical protein